MLAVGFLVLGRFFKESGSGFFANRDPESEKKSDPDKRTRIQTKETGSETLVKIISTWFNGCILTCGRASPPETPAVCPSQSD